MSPGEEQMKRIQEKLQQLLKQYAVLKKENESLKDEIKVIRDEAYGYEETVDKLKQQLDILKFTSGEMSDDEKKQFEKRINAYVKEIDRCIALLGD